MLLYFVRKNTVLHDSYRLDRYLRNIGEDKGKERKETTNWNTLHRDLCSEGELPRIGPRWAFGGNQRLVSEYVSSLGKREER